MYRTWPNNELERTRNDCIQSQERTIIHRERETHTERETVSHDGSDTKWYTQEHTRRQIFHSQHCHRFILTNHTRFLALWTLFESSALSLLLLITILVGLLVYSIVRGAVGCRPWRYRHRQHVRQTPSSLVSSSNRQKGLMCVTGATRPEPPLFSADGMENCVVVVHFRCGVR